MSEITAGASPFLSVPIELRLMIYAELFRAAPYNILTVPSTYQIPGLSLLQTNRQICNEARQTLIAQIYKPSQFRVNETLNVPIIAQFMSSLHLQAAAAITDLSLDWTTMFARPSQSAASNAIRTAYHRRGDEAWETLSPQASAISLSGIEGLETTHSVYQGELSTGGVPLIAALKERVASALAVLPRFTGLKDLTLLFPDSWECDLTRSGGRWDRWHGDEYLYTHWAEISRVLVGLKGVRKLVIGNTVEFWMAKMLANEMMVEEVEVRWWGKGYRRMFWQGGRRVAAALEGWRFEGEAGDGTGVRTMRI